MKNMSGGLIDVMCTFSLYLHFQLLSDTFSLNIFTPVCIGHVFRSLDDAKFWWLLGSGSCLLLL